MRESRAPNYAVAYAVGSSPFGPFERVGKVLQQDSTVATGAGHHSVPESPSGKWYIVTIAGRSARRTAIIAS